MPNFLRGTVQVIAEAYDTPTIPVPGIWNQHADHAGARPVAGRDVEREGDRSRARTAWDTRITLPSNGEFWRFYARGTFQNMAVFGKHYSWLQPGCFVFRAATLDTRKLPDNVYRLVVTAADVHGNHSSASLRFSIHNDHGLGRGLSAGFYRFGLTPLRLSFEV